MDRRTFLKTAAVGGVGLALPQGFNSYFAAADAAERSTSPLRTARPRRRSPKPLSTPSAG